MRMEIPPEPLPVAREGYALDTLLGAVASATEDAASAVIIAACATAVVISAFAFYFVYRQAAHRRRAERDLDSFFEISPDPFVVSTFDGRTLRVNHAYERAFGYCLDDLTGDAMVNIAHPDDRARVATLHGELVSGARSSVEFACRARCKDGSVRWITWHAAANRAQQLIFAAVRDETATKHAEDELRALNLSLERMISERTKAAEDRAHEAEVAWRGLARSEEQLRISVEHAPAAIAVFDREMKYLVASRQWSADYGLGGDSLVGRGHYEVFPEIEQRWRDIHTRCLGGATEACEEDAFPRQDGSVDWVKWAIHPWRTADGEVGGIIMFSEVITARKRAEEELLQVASDLQKTNSELETFTYSVSHDLKEPLRTLQAFSQILLEDYGDKLDEEGTDHLTRLARASARMRRLIDDLLTISRIGREAEPSEPVNVQRVIDDVVEGMRVTIDERGASVDVSPGLPDVIAHRHSIEQIFGNLVSNGIKFNRSAAPRVEVGAAMNASGELVFSVRDNGIGMEEQYYERIFQVFQRLHRRDEFEGTGAGLAIVRRAVEASGGRIWVESTPGEGSTFMFTLPPAGTLPALQLAEEAA